MPALTHGRCKNGFNQYARTIKYAQSRCNKKNEGNSKNNGKCYQKALCCGSPIQPQNLRPGHLFQRNRVPTMSCNRKYATNVVTGRSFAAKRAIARRVANCKKDNKTGTVVFQIQFDSHGIEMHSIEKIYEYLGSNPVLINQYVGGQYQQPWTLGKQCDIFMGRNYVVRKVTDIIFEISMNYDKIYHTIIESLSATGVHLRIINGANYLSYPPNMLWYATKIQYYSINGDHIKYDPPENETVLFGANEGFGRKYKFQIITTGSCCCLLPTLTRTAPRNAYRMPCSGGYIKKTLLNPCINPTTNNKLIK